MRVVLTTLSNHLFKSSRIRQAESARQYGLNDIISYDFEEIMQTSFYKENVEILSDVKTMGYWLWKPFIISEVMKTVDEGDIVIYCDAGIEVIGDLKPLIDICRTKSDILLFANGNFKNRTWTKRDCFVLMDCDAEEYWNGTHCDAALCIFKKSKKSIVFLDDWLRFGVNPNIITDIPNVCGKDNLPEFLGHRMDQSILSVLSVKYGLELYRMPTQFGNHYMLPEHRIASEFNCINQGDHTQLDYYSENIAYNSPYPQLLNHHRKKAVADNDKQHRRDATISRLTVKLKAVAKRLIKKLMKRELPVALVIANNYQKKSYSQCGEDLIVQYIFMLRGISQPTYLDIGANDPYFISNTALFYETGCRGINIEANPALHKKFLDERPADINLNIGISNKEEELDFYVMADNTLSSFSKEECDAMLAHGKTLETVKKIKLNTVANVLKKHFNDQFPDFMSLDVEGMDFQILKSIDFDKYWPKIICVEAAEYSPIGAGRRRNELIDFLVLKGYYEYANTNLNAIMVKNEFWFV